MTEALFTIGHANDASRRDVLDASQAELTARRLDQLVRRAPITCAPETPIRDVLETLRRENIGSMLVTFPDGKPVGIFTLRDLLARVALTECSIAEPISSVMTRDPVSLPAHAFALEAAAAMTHHGVQHIVVTDAGKVVGLVSERDLFTLRQTGLAHISTALRAATRLPVLIELSGNIRDLAAKLLEQGVSAEHLTRIVSSLNDVLSQRVIEIELASAGLNAGELCWISLGSEGRHEQTLATDQDNGIIFADPREGIAQAVRRVLVPVARKINEDLDACGFPLCRGNIMASNPRWCLSTSEWREAFGHWIFHGDADAVLNATIFFDFRPLYGQASLAEELRTWLTVAAADNRRFLRQLAENALINRPPLGIVRDFAVSADHSHPNTIDLKTNGVTLFIDAARVCALAAGIASTNTVQRLSAWAARGGVSAAELDGWASAFHFLQLLRLRHQQAQIARGEPPDNHLEPARLNTLDRRILREALRLAKNLQTRLALDYQL